MLSVGNRLRLTAEFRSVARSGVRVGRPSLVLHAVSNGELPSKVGFAVSKAVGGAVVRNRVKRQLRHLVRAELTATDPHARIVVRALPKAASENERLAADLHQAWAQLIRKLQKTATIAETQGVIR
ncbi:MAG: ribonuclease P protein component [Propionibacteriaceae bacterium]|jgi:ribonuclease P protein component|nr:ribonuclease P protein component [Propionibacteriaceae bacterium]